MRARFWKYAGAAVLALAAAGRGAPTGLADDGRVAVVADLQGTVLVQPAGRQRWSPVGPDTILLPGDQLRTMPRGANAAEIRLAGGGSLVLGAGGLLRLPSRGVLHLVRGDAELTGAEGMPLRVSGPGGFEKSVTDTVVLRADGERTAPLAQPPRWLEGYRASTTGEWLGSLVANVDGRDVPLSVGYHKVDVVIRDQIAVTTVEESFVNSTHGRLEGTFSFPLPAGASVSGFGMWIDGELVEADIVERQRARQIYEDIRSRRKDPGLLEWSGGNVFKASVFPIPANGEKRIRLRYTQVLPLEGSRVRYRYALRSELLRKNPLRRLQIRVRNHSAAPIESASSPTHDVSVTQTTHDATLEYSDEDVVPDRDFEASFVLARTESLRVVPHRRGEDGYFMLLFSPPDAGQGEWQRELVPEGAPLDVLFVADTSGSMSTADRVAQRDFIASALALLGPEDRFRLMACDAVNAWPVAEPLAVTDENVAAALTALEHRLSLGWTDLDAALAEAASHAKDGTVVVYVGDGIGTTGDADPVALAQRIRRMQVPAGAAFHAVATGSSHEEGVLDAIASLGGGSRRALDGDPARAAYALLSEVAQPPVKDLQVAFEGLRTARVYPERLPSVPAGTQQIVLGRFLPAGAGPQHGKVVVSGTRDGKPLRVSAELEVAEEEEGNSFLPRLWARRHLDALLAEGRTPAIRDEIVSFSERFGIMTPYTSLLVLENDEDRALYGVARRVHMRDGERFFADAAAAADTAALREQVAKARSWRLALRRRMLAEIAGLGRRLYVAYGYAANERSGPGGVWGPRSGGMYRGPAGELAEAEPVIKDAKVGDHDETADGDIEELDGFAETPPDAREPSDPAPEPDMAFEQPAPAGAPRFSSSAPFDGPSTIGVGGGAGHAFGRRRDAPGGGKAASGLYAPWRGGLLFQRFPGLPAPAPRTPAPEKAPWDDEVRAILESVSAPPVLPADVDAGVEVRTLAATPRSSAAGLTVARTDGLVARDRWLVHASWLGRESQESWAAEQRGTLAAGQRLGRRRPAVDEDRDDWSAYLGLQNADWARAYFEWSAAIESRDGALVTILLTPPNETGQPQRLVIDTEKHLIVRQDSLRDGKVVWSQSRLAPVLAGGLWWPTEQVTIDGEGKETYRVRLTVRELARDAFAERFDRALAAHADAIFLDATDPGLDAARQAVADGRAGFVDHMVIAADHAAYQRWDEVWTSWEQARALLEGKPGVDWIELVLFTQSRRGEELVAQARRMADALAARRDEEARALAFSLFQQGTPFQADERLAILDVLRRAGVDDDVDAEDAWWDAQWERMRAGLLFSAGRRDEAVDAWRALCKRQPAEAQNVLGLLNALTQSARVDDALALLDTIDTSAPEWDEYQVRNAFRTLAQVAWNSLRFDAVLRLSERWTAAAPADTQAYQARLAALLALGRVEERDAWMGAQLDAAAEAGEDAAARAKLQAAVAAALGNEWDGRWYGGPIDTRWEERLVGVAADLSVDGRSDPSVVAMIVQRRRYHEGDLQQRLIDTLRARLAAPGVVEALPPVRLSYFASWLPWDRVRVDGAVWRDVTDRVRARLRGEEDQQSRSVLFGVALRLLDMHEEPAEAVDLLRETLAGDTPPEVPGHADQLLARLAQLPWSAPMEDEMIALLPRLAPPGVDESTRRGTFGPAVRWLADRLFAMRVEALLGAPAEREKLPRAELRANQRAARVTARRALAERFRQESAASAEALRPWYEIERICFLAESGEDVAAVEGEAREMLLSIATAADDPDGAGGDVFWALRERSVLALSYLALRRDAPDELPGRVVALLRERLEKDADALDWRYAIFRLLVALDRPEDLETALRSWIVPALVESRWRVALGYLLAETERLDEATALFEEVARLDELDEADYVSLADWYLVLRDDARRASAQERRYRLVDEYRLAQYVQQQLYAQRRGDGGDGVPPDLDIEVLRMLRVLFGKSSTPERYAYLISNLYGATKDFRVLAALADGIVGHTPGSVYPFLQQTAGLVQSVHEEASCDELRVRIQARIADARTDTDRRALQLLMAQVERRAGEVLDQPGPHLERSLAHLREARRGAWLPGERRLMAEYLAALGRIPHAALAEEQIAQLRDLHAGTRSDTPAGTVDRIRTARCLYLTLWGYDRRDEAIDGLVAALDEHRTAHGGALPDTVNDIVDMLAGWYEAAQRFGAGEALLLAERERQPSVAQKQWFTRRVFALYVECLWQGGSVSHGSGAELYRTVRGLMERALVELAPDRLTQDLDAYCRLHRGAHERAKVKGVADDLVRFSRTLLPEVLPRFGEQQGQPVLCVAETLRSVAGPLAALTLLVERLEAEPEWVRRRGNDGWAVYGGRAAQWRHETGKRLGDLEPRLLAVALRELERDLATQQQRDRSMFQRCRVFWAAHAADFAAVARRVIAEHARDPGVLLHTAAYQWGGLDLRADAIRTLQGADERGALVRDGRWTLLSWLLEEKRWPEALPHAQRLIEEWPDDIRYRLSALRILHALERDDEGRALVDATAEHFAVPGGSGSLRGTADEQLGNICLECGWYRRSVTFLSRAAADWERATRASRREGDARLASLYGQLARAHAGLAEYDEAVDAATSAVVAMGPSQDSRRHALSSLAAVLQSIPDLPAWTERYEAEAAATGLDAPVIRRALAQIHLGRKEPVPALHHLRVALRHTPEDVTLHDQVIAACRMQGDPDAVAAALADSLAHVPAQPERYAELAELRRRMGDEAEAERALTGLAEYAPNEPDGHRRLASLRAAAGRHAEAVVQWQQVVRTKSLDATGWLELARAQARAGDPDAARATLDAILAQPWGPAHRAEVERVSQEIASD